MKRTTAFFLGLIVLVFIVWKTTAWDQVKKMMTNLPIPSASSTMAFLETAVSTSTAQTFVGDRTKPYFLRLTSGEGTKALTWQLTVDKNISGFAYTAAEVYEVYGNVIAATDELVFSAQSKEGIALATATTTWRGSTFSGVALTNQTTSTIYLASDRTDSSAALVTFQRADGEWTQEKPNMGCEFHLTLPVVQVGNGVSSASANRMNQTIREQILGPSAYILEGRPSSVAAPSTPAQAKDVFIRTCRAQLADELRSFQDDISSVGGMFQRSVDVSPRITFNQSGYLSFTSDLATYTGGAHGSNQRLTFVFDTKTGERLQIQDVIRPDARAVFDQRLGRELLHQYADELFEDSAGPIRAFVAASPTTAQQLWTRGESGISTSTAFYLVGHGINVVFQQYEVTPYAVGLPELYLPSEGWADLGVAGRNIF